MTEVIIQDTTHLKVLNAWIEKQTYKPDVAAKQIIYHYYLELLDSSTEDAIKSHLKQMVKAIMTHRILVFREVPEDKIKDEWFEEVLSKWEAHNKITSKCNDWLTYMKYLESRDRGELLDTLSKMMYDYLKEKNIIRI